MRLSAALHRGGSLVEPVVEYRHRSKAPSGEPLLAEHASILGNSHLLAAFDFCERIAHLPSPLQVCCYGGVSGTRWTEDATTAAIRSFAVPCAFGRA